MTRDVALNAADGYALAATWHEPPADRPRAAVVLASAMAVPRSYYAPFARFLAAAGLAVLTFDYRGIGDSRPSKFRGFPARLHDWGELDLAAALATARATDLGPVLLAGHSVGGQLAGLARGIEHVGAMLTVAAQSGHWRHWTGLPRLGMFLAWHVAIPATCHTLGNLPMPRGQRVPAGVALEWARWGRDPGYFLPYAKESGATGYDTFDRPWLSYSLADDRYAPRRSVEALHACYPRARTEHRHVAPADAGARHIGHFGFFRPRLQPTLWTEARDWLLAHLSER